MYESVVLFIQDYSTKVYYIHLSMQVYHKYRCVVLKGMYRQCECAYVARCSGIYTGMLNDAVSMCCRPDGPQEAGP